jgi:hypothetical protein
MQMGLSELCELQTKCILAGAHRDRERECVCVCVCVCVCETEGKDKVVFVLDEVPCHEDILGSGGIALRILNLGARCRRVVSFTSRPLYPVGKSKQYPLDRGLSGSQNRSGRCGKEK